MTLRKVLRATAGSVMPASENSPLSAGIPWRFSNPQTPVPGPGAAGGDERPVDAEEDRERTSGDLLFGRLSSPTFTTHSNNTSLRFASTRGQPHTAHAHRGTSPAGGPATPFLSDGRDGNPARRDRPCQARVESGGDGCGGQATPSRCDEGRAHGTRTIRALCRRPPTLRLTKLGSSTGRGGCCLRDR
jgi:hypothetical protein